MTDTLALYSARRKIRASVKELLEIPDETLTVNEVKVIVAVRRGLERLDRHLYKKVKNQMVIEEGE